MDFLTYRAFKREMMELFNMYEKKYDVKLDDEDIESFIDDKVSLVETMVKKAENDFTEDGELELDDFSKQMLVAIEIESIKFVLDMSEKEIEKLITSKREDK